MKKKKHRRHYFWVPFLVFSTLLFFLFEQNRLPSWLSAWLYGPPATLIEPQAPSAPVPTALEPLETFRFESEADLARWEKKIFKGQTEYAIRRDEDGRPYLAAESGNSSCGLFMKLKHKADPGLYLSWKWRARTFPQKKDPSALSNRSSDDFAARVYVIFEASNLFRSDVIEYVWDESIAEGSVSDSPYSDRIKLFVVRSGAACEESGGWCSELRNPLQDYMKLFGKAPRNPVGIVALMTDSDNTGTSAAADFAEIAFGNKKTDHKGEGST